MVDWLLIDYWVTSTEHSWREHVPKQTKSKWGTVGPNGATTLHCHQKNIENWVGTPNFVVRSGVLWRFLDAFFNFCCLISFLLYFILVLSCLSRLLLFFGLCVVESLVDGLCFVMSLVGGLCVDDVLVNELCGGELLVIGLCFVDSFVNGLRIAGWLVDGLCAPESLVDGLCLIELLVDGFLVIGFHII